VALNTITLTLKPGTHDDFLRPRWLFFKISRQDVYMEWMWSRVLDVRLSEWVPAVTVTVFKHRNKIGKTVVKAVPYSVT
jgi:hypothetical protein